jgi:hypothetical protein
MNDFIDTHTPRPEFRAALERDLVSALRRETRFAPYNRIARGARARTLMLIVIGAVLGVGCGYASAQVRESQVRSELLAAAEASLKVASLRLEMAQDRVKRVQRMFEAGVITRRELVNAESELRAMEIVVAQANLDIEEIRASSAPPRQELWAPAVGGRDFVKQRLQLKAARAQQQLTEAEVTIKELDERVRVGALSPVVKQEAMTVLLQAQQEMADVARQLLLRQQFVEQKLDVAAISQQLKVEEVQSTLMLTEAQSKLAEQRAALAKAKMQIGSASELDVKVAEVELLQLRAKIHQLLLELKAIQGGRRDQ